VRGFLPGFAYQCGVLFASSVAYLEAIFATRTSYANAMAATALTVCGLAAVVVVLGRERKGAEFGIPSTAPSVASTAACESVKPTKFAR
jgi:SHS family lactate transporter-like MFS transporter